MLKTEESKVAVVILITFVVLLLSGIFPQYVMWTTVALLVLIVGLAAYAAISKRKKLDELQDERTAKCSLMASRNGFIVAMVLLAIIAGAVRMGAPYRPVDMVQIVWGLGITTYLLSYLFYKRIA